MAQMKKFLLSLLDSLPLLLLELKEHDAEMILFRNENNIPCR